MQGTSEIREIEVLGDWAYLRNYIQMTIMPPSGEPVRRAGYTLTILHKVPDGRWLLFDRVKPEGGDVWMLERAKPGN